jgi:hypothetical protein
MQNFNLDVHLFHPDERNEDNGQTEQFLRSAFTKWELEERQVCMVVVGPQSWFRDTAKNFFSATTPEIPIMTCFKMCIHQVYIQCEEYLFKEKFIEQTINILEYFW